MRSVHAKIFIYSGAALYWLVPLLFALLPDQFGFLLNGIVPILTTQTGGSILCLIGFSGLLSIQISETKRDPIAAGLRGKFVTAGLVAIIAGVTLAFPLLQISLRLEIATITTFSGIALMFVSLAIWIITLVFFPKIRPKKAKPNRKLISK
jgi:hypothetical protein